MINSVKPLKINENEALRGTGVGVGAGEVGMVAIGLLIEV